MATCRFPAAGAHRFMVNRWGGRRRREQETARSDRRAGALVSASLLALGAGLAYGLAGLAAGG